ncbi:LacI family transcriptional regulator [Paractinoplanes abujensis]|uniref:DNA-binding LacI/PurR family transcriptional regulator n=1 Tax=Paractinoplanes abujensis TaxID=882441 RepID=A0A7W7CPY7_9ACTN|nr:LacI family DNA-binding transcriptional regulator [Actinoplanes abujensis]MBB4692533.1 DNA-binding LacI/PurR family transcriptional regulator [Actinoplanes abujensis]GID22970.1 LacI family transcriptional regulator [Actinoplanes abujensis]
MTRSERPTIVDVARAAGVSKGTVSFALNGRPGVAEETRQRILDAARDLGWTPSHQARALSVSRAFAVGLVLAREPELLGADPFFPAFIAGVERTLSDRGQALVLQVVPEAQEEAGYRRLAADGRVDGVFLLDLRVADPRIALLAELGLPAVSIARPEVPSPFPAVLVDDRPGIAAAVGHLVELGHTTIAHVAGPSHFLHGRVRRQAFEQAVKDAGLRPGPVVEADFSAAGGARATREVLVHKPTAIVYANDLMAIAGLSVASELGVVVPAQLSITGFDNTDLAAYVSPPLTTVRTDPYLWGRAAADALLASIEGGTVDDVPVPAAQLVVRASTSPMLPAV